MHRNILKTAIISVSILSVLSIFAFTSCSCGNNDEPTIEAQIATLQTKYTSLDSRLKTAEGKLPDSGTITSLQTKLNNFESSLQTLQNDVDALNNINPNNTVTSAELEAIVSDLDNMADDITQLIDDIAALSDESSASANLVAGIETAIVDINLELTSINERITTLENTTDDDFPYIVIDRFRSSGLELTVYGEGYFAVMVTLYGQNLMAEKAVVDGCDIDGEYLYGQEVKEEWLSEAYHILPTEIESEPGGTDDHTHTIDLDDVYVVYPVYSLSDKGTMLILMLIPDIGDWNGEVRVEIEFDGMVVNYASAEIGVLR